MPRTRDQKDRNVGGTSNNSGKNKGGPSFSVKGFTSKDPANVARNREGASRYATKSERIAASGKDSNADKAAIQTASRARRPVVAAPVSKVAPPTTAPKPGMVATRAPAGYRPGIDPEFNYSTGVGGTPTAPRPATPRPAMAAMAAPVARVKPTITLAKGGKAKPKMKK